jgi:16S rRNA (adenine1518-N6/adenine1519-N6)-dimethyltransferase
MSLYAEEIRRIKNLMAQMGRGSKKALGQNFLVNAQKISHIIEAAKKENPATVIEVGPGLGALTIHLRENFSDLTLLEMDDQFAQYWKDQGCKVVHGDALKIDWNTLGLKNALLVSNLPYQISSRIVVERSVNPAGITAMVLMFQKEVAQRITAKHKNSEYGLLTVIAQTFWETEFFAELGPNDFYPPPKVASRVVLFRAKDASHLKDPVKFLKFVKLAFSQKRKFLKKSLLSLVPANKLEPVFAELGLSLMARPEEVSVEQFSQLFLKLGAQASQVSGDAASVRLVNDDEEEE